MSSASKSRSMANKTARAIKEEHPLVSLNPSNVLSDGAGEAASAYDPVLDGLHSPDIAQSATFTIQKTNGQSRSIDDTEDHSLSPTCTTNEYDSGSNNDSSSGETEVDQKEKTPPNTASRSDPIPVPDLDADKRDKIRLENGKKHQRQREKRAKELHARCCGYLKSRKVEVLAQPLVLMGFPLERAKTALILNECCIEESVAWLLQDGEENNNKQHTVTNIEDAVSHLKIDISGELAKIEDLEIKYSCSKQEVERAVVCCEGDLEKAEDTLKAQKQEQAAAASHPKMEERGNPSTSNVKLEGVASDHILKSRSQAKGIASQHQGMDERHRIYRESLLAQAILQETTNMNLQSRKTMQPQPDWVRTQIATAAEKRWPITSLSSYVSPPSGFSRHGFPVQVSSSKSQNIILGGELKPNFHLAMREPVKVMQRPQSFFNPNQRLQSTSTSFIGSPPNPSGWYSNEISSHSKPFDSSSMEFSKMRNNSQPASSPLLAAPSSLGLFSDWGALLSSGKSSTIDWKTDWGSVPRLDYASIDWSLDTSQQRSSTIDDVQLSDSVSLVRKATSSRPLIQGGYFPGAQNTGRFMDGHSSSSLSQAWTPFFVEDLLKSYSL